MAIRRTQLRHTSRLTDDAQLGATVPHDAATTAVHYYRLSANAGAEEKQEDRLAALDEKHAATCVAAFTDDELPASYNPEFDDGPKPRPGFDKLLDYITTRRPAYVVALAPARIARNNWDWSRFEAACARAGTLVLTERGVLNLRSLTDRAQGQMQAIFDGQYSAAISEGVRSKMAGDRVKGIPRSGGVRPYGLRDDRMTPDREEAKVIRWLVSRVLAGDEIKALARSLNDRGVPGPGAAWTANGIKKMLRRASVCGWLAVDGEMLRPFPVTETGTKPIIDRETFDRVVALLDSRSASPGGRSPLSDTYFLSGLLRCGAPDCDAEMFGSLHTRSDGSRVRKYRCRHAHQVIAADDYCPKSRCDGGDGCTHDDDRLPGVETVVRALAIAYASDAKHMHTIAAAAEERSARWHELHEKKQRLERDRSAVQTARDDDGELLPWAETAPRLAAIRADLKAVDAEMRTLDATPADALARMQQQTRERLETKWDAPSTTGAERRAMVAAVLSGVRVQPAGRGCRPTVESRLQPIER